MNTVRKREERIYKEPELMKLEQNPMKSELVYIRRQHIQCVP